MIVLGIDPGASGALAWGTEFNSESMPFPYASEVDINEAFRKILGGEFEKTKLHAFIEAVHSFPGQGVASSFAFGKSYGFLRGLLIANKIAFETVQPRAWQKTFNMKSSKEESKTDWKRRLKARAQEMFPRIKVTLATADALLIMEHGRRQLAARLVK